MENFEEHLKNLFRQQHCKVGHILPMSTIEERLLNRLNPVEKRSCLDTIDSLIKDGFCTYEEGSIRCLRLTEKGYEGLYPKRSMGELEDMVMNLFKKQNCDVGQGVMEIQLRNLVQSLNPEDSSAIIDAANGLIQQGYFVYEAKSPAFLRLTKKGYDRIYK